MKSNSTNRISKRVKWAFILAITLPTLPVGIVFQMMGRTPHPNLLLGMRLWALVVFTAFLFYLFRNRKSTTV